MVLTHIYGRYTGVGSLLYFEKIAESRAAIIKCTHATSLTPFDFSRDSAYFYERKLNQQGTRGTEGVGRVHIIDDALHRGLPDEHFPQAPHLRVASASVPLRNLPLSGRDHLPLQIRIHTSLI